MEMRDSENILLMVVVLLVIAIAAVLFWYEALNISNKIAERIGAGSKIVLYEICR